MTLMKLLLKQWENSDLAKPDILYIIQKVMMRAFRKCNFYQKLSD